MDTDKEQNISIKHHFAINKNTETPNLRIFSHKKHHGMLGQITMHIIFPIMLKHFSFFIVEGYFFIVILTRASEVTADITFQQFAQCANFVSVLSVGTGMGVGTIV